MIITQEFIDGYKLENVSLDSIRFLENNLGRDFDRIDINFILLGYKIISGEIKIEDVFINPEDAFR